MGKAQNDNIGRQHLKNKNIFDMGMGFQIMCTLKVYVNTVRMKTKNKGEFKGVLDKYNVYLLHLIL